MSSSKVWGVDMVMLSAALRSKYAARAMSYLEVRARLASPIFGVLSGGAHSCLSRAHPSLTRAQVFVLERDHLFHIAAR